MSSLFSLATATVGGGHRNRAAYRIDRSVRLRSSASAYFNRTMAPAGVTVYTFSAWVKRGELGTIKPIVQGYLNNNNYGHIIFKADNTIEWREVSVAANYGQVNTNAVFRDPSAWYHIVVVRDGTSLLIYVNGVSQTLTVSTAVNAAAGYLFGGSTVQRIGSDQVNSAFFDGYLTECYLIDGQALTPTSFGSTNATTGVWQPKKYAGTYGTNGFYLNFSDNSAATAAAIGADYSGNGNNWTPNNISVTAGVTYDSMLDVPTLWADGGNGRGNYATLNPLAVGANSSQITYSNANLNTAWSTTATYAVSIGTIGVASGKWYWEVINTSTANSMVGILKEGGSLASYVGQTADGYSWYSTGSKYNSGSGSAYGAAYAQNDVVGVALDLDAGTLTFYKNGTSQGQAFSGLSGTFFPAISDGDSAAAVSFAINFGQRPFAYTPPTGFKALNTLNLPEPTILKGNQYFDATLWDGNSTDARVITSNVGTVDFAWVKKRNGIDDHRLANSVLGGNRHLKSNATDAESTGTTVIQAFNGSTFTVGTDNSVNATGSTYVGWQWKEGATQGFDIVTYTGTLTTSGTVAINHNLGVAPKLVISKSTNNAGVDSGAWFVWTSVLATDNYLRLNTTAAAASISAGGGGTMIAPTSSVFYTPYISGANINANNYVAYLFAEVAGFSKFGSYTGNGSAGGPFVYLGFKPRFVMLKASSTTGDWIVYDSSRNTYNVADLYLYPNSSAAEAGSGTPRIDFLSNGFKLRNTGQGNVSAVTFIYMAFAEHPFKNAVAR